MKNLTWPQAFVLVASIALTFAAYKFLGAEAGAVGLIATGAINFAMGRGEAKTSE